jgi:hypothetical protein
MQHHAYTPWEVQMLTRAQPRRFHVARQVEDGTWSSPHWEQMPAADGGIARFETAEEARAAIAADAGVAA